MKALVTTLSALALAGALSFAQQPAGGGQGPAPGGPGPGAGQKGRPSPEELFKKLDTNGDGVLSLEEFKAFHPPGGPGGGGQGPGKGGQGGPGGGGQGPRSGGKGPGGGGKPAPGT